MPTIMQCDVRYRSGEVSNDNKHVSVPIILPLHNFMTFHLVNFRSYPSQIYGKNKEKFSFYLNQN